MGEAGKLKYSVTCWSCGGGGVIEDDCDCMDDTCCCLEPTPPDCSECGGKGYVVVTKLTDDNCEDAIPIHDGRRS